MQEVAGLPPDQVELMRSLPAWEARLAMDTATDLFTAEVLSFLEAPRRAV